VAFGARFGATRRGGDAAAGNGIKSGPPSSSCLGSAGSWDRTHARLRSPCPSGSCQRENCWGSPRQPWRRGWAWIEGRSVIGSEACGFPPRKGSQRSRHSFRQVAGSRLEFQLLQPADFQRTPRRQQSASCPGSSTSWATTPIPFRSLSQTTYWLHAGSRESPGASSPSRWGRHAEPEDEGG
jgi:hypothetical protein